MIAAAWHSSAHAQVSLTVSNPINSSNGVLSSDFLNGTAGAGNSVSLTGAGGTSGALLGATISGSTRYISGVGADNGAASTSSSSATMNTDYSVPISLTAPTTHVYQFSVSSRITGSLTALDDVPNVIFNISGDPGTSSISAVTGRLNGTVNGGLGLLAGGLSRGGTTNDSGEQTPFNATNTMTTGPIQGTGFAAANTLRFTWNTFASSPNNFALGGDEQAVRLGFNDPASGTFGTSADDYPGIGGANIANDGHFLTITATVVNTQPVARAGGPYVYSAANLTRTLSGATSTTGLTANEGGQALTYNWTSNGNPIATGLAPNVSLATSGLAHTTSTATVGLTVTDNGPLNMVSAPATTTTFSYTNVAPTANAGAVVTFNGTLANRTATGTITDADQVANAQVAGFESQAYTWKTAGNAIGNTPNGSYVGSTATTNPANTITFAQAVAAGIGHAGQSIPLTLQTTDFAGLSSTSSTTITYANTAPTANAGAALTLNAAQTSVNTAGSAGDIDLAANAVTAGFEFNTYQWKSGASPIGIPGNGLYNGTSTTFSPSNNVSLAQAAAAGLAHPGQSIPLTLSVTDYVGATTTSNTTLTYTNAAPTANAGAPLNLSATQTTVTTNGTGTDADLASNAIVPGFEKNDVAWTSGASPIGTPASSTVTASSASYSAGTNITLAQAQEAGLAHPGQSIPLTISVTDYAGASATSNTTLGYTNMAPIAVAGPGLTLAANQVTVNTQGAVADLDLFGNLTLSTFEKNDWAWTSNGNPIGTTANGSHTSFIPGYNPLNTITIPQATAAGLVHPGQTIPLQLTATDYAGASSSDNTTLTYINTVPLVASASSASAPGNSLTLSALFPDADLMVNGFVSAFEDLLFEFDLSPATSAADVGDGFLTGVTTPSETVEGALAGTLSLPQLISLFGGKGTFTVYANVRDYAGAFASLPFDVNVVPEPATWLIWTGLAAGAFWARRRRTPPAGAR